MLQLINLLVPSFDFTPVGPNCKAFHRGKPIFIKYNQINSLEKLTIKGDWNCLTAFCSAKFQLKRGVVVTSKNEWPQKNNIFAATFFNVLHLTRHL